MKDVLIQIIGYIGLIFYLASFQIKSNRKFFILQFTGALIFGIQFFLLNAYSGFFSLITNMIRSLILSKYQEWKLDNKKYVKYIFLLIYILIFILTWAGPISILCLVASLVSTIFYFTNNAKNIRACNLFVASPCWLTYDALIKSWGGVLTESITIISILVSIIRFGWKSLADPNSEINQN